MSPPPIAHSPDLALLRDEGFTVRIAGGHLVIDDIPYVDSEGTVHDDGALVMALNLAGDRTTRPGDHTAYWVGLVPCTITGAQLDNIINNTNPADLGDGIMASAYFSAKPTAGAYTDYHHKVITYVGHIAGPAVAIDSSATPRRFRPVEADDTDATPFRYLDTASSRAGIDSVNERLSDERVGIIGVGGTGAYVLDLVAKTRAPEIHLFDADVFLTHNAFRSPGAPTLEQLNERPTKVDHLAAQYSNMHSRVIPHPVRVDDTNVEQLRGLSFAFVAIDDAAAKAPIIAALRHHDIPFIDVGMGVDVVDGQLRGLIRSTLVTPDRHDHLERRIPTIDAGAEGEYRSNIQIAELNMLNAAHAVIMWKKFRHVYADTDHPHSVMFNVATNGVANDECDEVIDVREEDAA